METHFQNTEMHGLLEKKADLSWVMNATVHGSEALACICASISSAN